MEKVDLLRRKKLLENRIITLEEDIYRVHYVLSEIILNNAIDRSREEIAKIEKEVENMEKVEYINATGQISELIYKAKHSEEE